MKKNSFQLGLDTELWISKKKKEQFYMQNSDYYSDSTQCRESLSKKQKGVALKTKDER